MRCNMSKGAGHGLESTHARKYEYGAIGSDSTPLAEAFDTHESGDSTPLAAWTTEPLLPFSPRWLLFSIRGAEWFHLYLWMLKDLFWTVSLLVRLSPGVHVASFLAHTRASAYVRT